MKRESTSTVDKPVLDEETFQQLLAAANILQQHNYGLLAKEPEADYALTLSDGATAENVGPIQVVRPETVARPVASLEPQPKPTHPARLGYLYRTLGKGFALTDELFWKAATVAAAAAVSALLLGATIYHLSPLPSALAVPPEGVQQQVPFKAKRIARVPAESGAFGMRSWSRRAVVADQSPGRRPSPASAQKTGMNRARPYSTYESEADVVAKDTTVRYDTHSAAPRLQARKKH